MAEKKTSALRILIIFILVFISVPLITATVIYYTNSTFESAVNDFLKEAPGFIGEHFRKIPTNEEREDKITDLAQYYLEIEPERAAEKLYIIKKDDERLFNEIKDMINSLSTNKTKKILGHIRNIEIRNDMLVSIYDEMQTEKENVLSSDVKRLETMDINLAIKDIEGKIDRDPSYLTTIGKIIEGMDQSKAIDILYYINNEDKTLILNMVNDEKREELDSLIAERTFNESKLVDLSKIYEVKDTDTAFNEIGSIGTYSAEQLAIIYMNLSPKKAAEILINSQDQDFIDNLLKLIREEERLRKNEDSKALKISQVLSYLYDYNRKIDELVEVYEKMDPNSLGDIVESMLRKENGLTSFEIDSNELYRVSDASIILDVLRKMKKSTVSDVLDSMTPIKATELSRKLILE